MADDDNIIHVRFGRGGRRVPAPSGAEPGTVPRPRNPLMDAYSLADAARLFGIPERKLRHWERVGIVMRSGHGQGRPHFTFQDLIGIRAASGLLDAGVPLRNVRRSVEALRASLPKVARPLSSLRVLADGQDLLVRDPNGTYNPMTGQLCLDFETSALCDDVVRVLQRGPGESAQRKAYDYYLEGCRYDELEATSDRAEAAYRKALELDPTLTNALTNLGNLLFRRGDVSDAERLYIRALRLDPDQPEAFYNLGFLLYERGELEPAALNFKRALRSDPGFADAHFNLAMVLCDLGRSGQARPHWEAYLELDPQSAWAEVARRHLDQG